MSFSNRTWSNSTAYSGIVGHHSINPDSEAGTGMLGSQSVVDMRPCRARTEFLTVVNGESLFEG